MGGYARKDVFMNHRILRSAAAIALLTASVGLRDGGTFPGSIITIEK